MREQRANLMATIVTAATLAGAVPAALLALGGAFGPVSWPQPDGRAGSAPPLRLPSPPARPPTRPRHPATIRPAPPLHAATIIPALRMPVAAAPRLDSVPRQTVPTRRLALRPSRRAAASPRTHHRLVAERRQADTSHVTPARVQLPTIRPTPQPAPVPSVPTASTAAVTNPAQAPGDKAKQKGRKQDQKMKRLDNRQKNAKRETQRNARRGGP